MKKTFRRAGKSRPVVPFLFFKIIGRRNPPILLLSVLRENSDLGSQGKVRREETSGPLEVVSIRYI